MFDPAIRISNLTKSYGSIEALRGINLEVERGEVFALLGPNGAGKTTTVEIMEGYRNRDGGDVSVLGHDPQRNERAMKERIGIVLQETGVERFLSVAEVIELYGGYYPSPRPVDEVLEVVGLTEKRNERVLRLSGGQQRRLDVALGLAGDPELLFLDEPTTGFDPRARRDAWQMISNLKDLGKTVFLTTHYMDEAQNLADRVAIIVQGRIVAEGRPDELVDDSAGLTTIRFTRTAGELPADLAALATEEGGRFQIVTDSPTQVLNSLTGWALKSAIDLQNLTVSRPNLEDIYLDLTSDTQATPETVEVEGS